MFAMFRITHPCKLCTQRTSTRAFRFFSLVVCHYFLAASFFGSAFLAGSFLGSTFLAFGFSGMFGGPAFFGGSAAITAVAKSVATTEVRLLSY